MKNLLYNKPTQVFVDAGTCALAWIAAYQVRYEGDIPGNAYSQLIAVIVPIAIAQIGLSAMLGVYKYQWRYVSIGDALHIARAYVLSGVLFLTISLTVGRRVPVLHVPFTIIATAVVLSFVGAISARLARRLQYERESAVAHSGTGRRFLLVGAGTHGATVAREMVATRGIKVVGFVDDDPHKQGAVIAGVTVLGRTADLPQIVESHKVDEVLVCISPKSRHLLHLTDVETASGIPVPSRIVPTIEDVLDTTYGNFISAKSGQIQPHLNGESDGMAKRHLPGNGNGNAHGMNSHLTVEPAGLARNVAVGKVAFENGNGNGNNGGSGAFRVMQVSVPTQFPAAVVNSGGPKINEVSIIQNKTILITGGAGFIGSSLAEKLVDRNRVIVLDHSFSGAPIEYTSLLRHPNITPVQGSILDADLPSLVREADVVVHAAAILGVNRVCNAGRETLETNYVGTSRILKALEANSSIQRFVYFSTSEVFGVNSYRVHEASQPTIGPIAESRWSYAMSKLAGEHLVASYFRETHLPIAIVRPFNIFGPRRTGDYALRRFIISALRNEPLEIHGDGTQIRSWCYIDDFVSALLEMIARPEAVGEDFNIGHPGNTLTVFGLAQKVIQLTGSSSPMVFRESPFPDISIRVPSLDKARRLLGYEPKFDMNTGLQLTIEWYRDHLTLFTPVAPQISAGHSILVDQSAA